MASPFHAFRKHQKILLVTTGLMAMIAFVFVPQWDRYGRGGGGNNPEVVSSRYGTLHESDLQRMVQTRHVLKEFLERAYQQAFMKQGQPEAEPLIPYDATPNEQSTIDTMLAARKAEELGFVVNNDVINNYLRKLTAGKLSSAEIRDILAGYRIQDRAVSTDTIFAAIREEMLANKLRETYDVTLTVTPGQRWHHYLQLRDRVKVEMIPIPVANFIDQVPDPTPAEIEKFYNEYKDRMEVPDVEHHVRMASPEPGFKLPPRAQFRFLKADYEAFIDRMKSEVTAEEVEKYYNDNKDRLFKRTKFLGEDDAATKAPSAELTTNPEEKPATDEAKPDEPTGDEPKADEAKPDESKPEPKANEPKAGEAKPADNADEKQAEDKFSASFDLARDTQFINADVKDAEAQTEAKPAAEGKDAPAEEASPEKTAPAEDGDKKTDADEPAKEDPVADLKDTETKEPAEKPAADKAPTEFIPLSEVEDDIRKTLAREKAAAKIDALLQPIVIKLQSYSMSLSRRRSQDSSKSEAEPLVAPDMEAIAKENNLELLETALITYFQLADEPLGQSRVVSENVPFARAEVFASYAFANVPRLFAPVTTQDDDGNRYLIWKIKQEEETLPPLAEIEKEVIKAWKVIKARDLAMAEAEKLAKTAAEHKDSLSEVFSDKKDLNFINTEPFSWFTMGAVPGDFTRNRIRLNEIDGVEGADMAMMKKIFGLKDGEITVAMNHGKTVAYVIKMLGHEESLSELRNKFLGQPGPWLQMAQQQNYQQVIDALHHDIADEAKLSKKRDFDQRDRG